MYQLLAKYGVLTELLEEEQEALRRLGSTVREYRAGSTLIAGEIEDPDQLFIAKEGRLFASLELANGERAITRLYFPGDIMGTANVPFERATQTITANSDAELYIFPRKKLIEAFTEMPRVAAIFYTFAALENAILNDRLVSVGRTRGKARLASLILEISARENLVEPDNRDICHPMLTQEQIGDAIGLTVVQVSRLLKELSTDKLIRRDGNKIELLDRPALESLGEFRDRYQDIDLDWFDDAG